MESRPNLGTMRGESESVLPEVDSQNGNHGNFLFGIHAPTTACMAKFKAKSKHHDFDPLWGKVNLQGETEFAQGTLSKEASRSVALHCFMGWDYKGLNRTSCQHKSK